MAGRVVGVGVGVSGEDGLSSCRSLSSGPSGQSVRYKVS